MSPPAEYSLFDTAIGRCGVAWSPHGVRLLQLPEGRESLTRARLLERCPDAREAEPPASVRGALAAIDALLRGEACDLSSIELDMDQVPPFHQRVYDEARKIPPGATLSYGELAARLGSPGAARAVGQALRRNPYAIIVPCHRVLAAGGRLGGFTASGGLGTKLRLLALEGSGASPAFAGDGAFRFDPDAAVEHLRAADPRLRKLIDRVGPFRMQLQRMPSVFAALSHAIVYQQLTGKAAATIFARLCALFPNAAGGPAPEHIARASDEKLRSAGLSRSKLLSLRDLAEKARSGQLPELSELQAMDDETIVERLTLVRGIGRWTVEMLLMFRLGRGDVLPLDDYGVRKGFALTFGAARGNRGGRERAARSSSVSREPSKPGELELPSRAQLMKRGERWRPYRSVASWYLWRALDT